MPAVSRQVAGELHSVAWVVSQFVFVARSVARSRTQLYFSKRIAAAGNTIARCTCITPPATFLAIIIVADLTMAHVHTSF